jgi:hypothetical protein
VLALSVEASPSARLALTGYGELVRKKEFDQAELKIVVTGVLNDGKRRGAVEQQASCCNPGSESGHGK